jgi:hypothetical protein
MTLVLQYNDTFFTCHSFNNTHIIMTVKFTHYSGQIIYTIYIYIYIYIFYGVTALIHEVGMPIVKVSK